MSVAASFAHTELFKAKSPGSNAAKLNFFIVLVSELDEIVLLMS